MKINPLPIGILLNALLIISCNNQRSDRNAVANTAVEPTEDSVKFTATMVDNRRDPSCGMPVSAGIGDTLHYKNKVLGFCSKECRDDFLKDPEKNITAADLKE